MKYFFLAYALIAILVVSIGGFRGDKFTKTPIEIFPDMDRQDMVKAQTPNNFFADGMGARPTVAGAIPHGYTISGDRDSAIEFGRADGYYATGAIDDYFGNGMPEELGLTADNAIAFLNHGKEHYEINCAICHGTAGNGAGITANYGIQGIANLRAENFFSAVYPDGRLYDVITNGKGNMGAYKHNLTLRDRWAIVAYVRALQLASKAPTSNPQIKEAFDSLTADQ